MRGDDGLLLDHSERPRKAWKGHFIGQQNMSKMISFFGKINNNLKLPRIGKYLNVQKKKKIEPL